MAFDHELAERIRDVLGPLPYLTEKRMFGGLCFMVFGNMCFGIIRENLMARVGADAYEQALTESFTSEMDITGKPLTGFVIVDSEGIAETEDLRQWLNRCLDFALSLPPKAPKS